MAENPYRAARLGVVQGPTDPAIPEDNPFRKAREAVSPVIIPTEPNPYKAAREFEAERDGTATPEQQAQPKDLFDPALIARIDETIERHDALAQRGARDANADIWDVITGAARVGREFGGLIDKAVKEHAAGSGFLAAYILTKRGAAHLFKKFGGTPEEIGRASCRERGEISV